MNKVREQLPTGFNWLDDPWGFNWRVINAIKKVSLRKFWRYHSARLSAPQHQRPVFILGAPRSGTSMLFRLLSTHPELGSLGREGHDMWRKFHHPRRNDWHSDVLGEGQIAPGEQAFLRRYLYMHFDQQRFVEKTPENCLRLPYLRELYPDATFVHVIRDPREVMSSMLNGWRHPMGRFRSYYVPDKLDIPDYDRPHQWCFALIENWRDYKTKPLARIVAEQWKQHILGALTGRDCVASNQWIELSLHDFIANPVEETRALLDRLKLSNDKRTLTLALENTVINAMNESPPGDWRHNAPQLVEMLPLLETEIEACGYNYKNLLEETQTVAESTAYGQL